MIAMADYGNANGTGEVLAVQLCPGNRVANCAKSYIKVLGQGLALLPDDFYDEHGNLRGEKILVRADSPGSHATTSTPSLTLPDVAAHKTAV